MSGGVGARDAFRQVDLNPSICEKRVEGENLLYHAATISLFRIVEADGIHLPILEPVDGAAY